MDKEHLSGFGLKLHHLGFVVSSISAYEENMIYEEKISQVYDPAQDALLAIYSNFGSAFVELIEPQSPKSTTYNFLQKSGPSFHHLCYLSPEQSRTDALAKKMKWLKISGPTPAVLFDNDPVTFFLDRNRQIVEFLVRG